MKSKISAPKACGTAAAMWATALRSTRSLRLIISLLALSLCAGSAFAATYYVRPDGGGRWTAARVAAGFTGSAIGCNGTTDAAYPGSGVNQNCAYNDVRFLWDDQTYNNYPNWAVSGGDTVILRANTAGAPWRAGFQGDGSTTDPWCFGGGGPINCVQPPIPSGTSGAHTRFLGENYASCSTTRTVMTVNGPRVQPIPDVSKLTKIFGGHGAYTVLNATGSQYVDIQCLDISSFEPACQLQGSPQPNPCNRSIPVSDYASDALETSNTSGPLLLQDLYIHGLNSRGIHGQQGTGAYTVNRVWISIIPQTGYDFDDSTASGTASWSLTNSIIEASGCQQKNSPPNYPPLSDAQLFADIGVCYDQSSGSVIGDGIGTPPSSGFSVTMDSDIFQWNTQDGEDFGHMDTGSYIFTLTNTVSQHNMGQTFKNGWSFNDIKYLNDIALADCDRMVAGNTLPGGAPSTVNQYLTNGCRAGDNFSINFQHATHMLTANNTIVGYQPSFFDYKCVEGSNDCSLAVWDINNNIMVAYDNPAAVGQPPADYCGPSCNGGLGVIGTINRKNNIYFNMRACHANQQTPDSTTWTSTGEACTSPLFVSQPASPMASYSVLDGFNYNLTNVSPAIAGGVSYTGMLSTDYAGNTQTTPPVIGALIYATGTPTAQAPTLAPGTGYSGPATTVTLSTGTTSCTSNIAYNTTGAQTSGNLTGTTTGTSYSLTASGDLYAQVQSCSGYINSSITHASYTVVPQAATPTFTPNGGTSTSPIPVVFNSATSGVTLCYTSDGSTPTADGAGTCTHGTTLANGGTVSVTTSATYKAIATKSGYADSTVATSNPYVINIPTVPTTTVTGTTVFSGTITIP